MTEHQAKLIGRLVIIAIILSVVVLVMANAIGMIDFSEITNSI